MVESPAKAESGFDDGNDGRSSPSIGDITLVSTRSIDQSVEIKTLASILSDALELKDTNDEAKPDQAVAELDAGLEKLIRSERDNPFAKFECAWEFNPDLSEIPNPPRIKRDFAKAIKEEIAAVRVIQNAMMKYSTEINSKKHDFSDEILEFETTATVIACGQLQEVRSHLLEVAKEVGKIGSDDVEVAAELRNAYRQAQPWIIRCRQIIRQNHCSYKTNYELCVGN